MKKTILICGSVLALVGAIIIPAKAFAANGDLKFTVTSELNYPISGASISIYCTGGTTQNVGVTAADGTLTISTTTLQVGGSPDFSGALCGGVYGKAIVVIATSTGYIASSTASTTIMSNPDAISLSALKYGLKVIAMKAEDGTTNVMPSSGSPFSASGNLTLASSTKSGTAWYLAASSTASGGTLTATSSGYVNATISSVTTNTLSASTSVQKTVAFDDGTAAATIQGSPFKFGLKVTSFYDELGNSIMPISGSPFSNSGALNIITQVYSGNAWYIAASSTDGTGGTLTASVDGYVDQSVASVLTSTNTQYSLDIGSSGSTYHIAGLPFALKVSPRDASDNSITGATVTAGDAYGVTCTENGTTAVYYCAIPLAQTGVVAQAAKTGYVTATGSYTDRTAATDAEGFLNITLNTTTVSATTGGSGGGGGGGGMPVYNPSPNPKVSNCPVGLTCKPIVSNNLAVPVAGQSTVNQNLLSNFTRSLDVGFNGDDVKSLQAFLNESGFMVASTGPGSPGNETNMFGRLTQKALAAFQAANNITPSVGYFGPKTRAYIQSLHQ